MRRLILAVVLALPFASSALDQPKLGHYYLHKAMRNGKDWPLDQWLAGVVETVAVDSALAPKEGRKPIACMGRRVDAYKLAPQTWNMIDEYLADFRTTTGKEWPRETPLIVIVLSTLQWKFPCPGTTPG